QKPARCWLTLKKVRLFASGLGLMIPDRTQF
ncbi:MAG: hypothetical protein ACI85F_000366, partial [Bacteroidia bacterium]